MLRYLILILSALISAICTGSISPVLTIFGVQPDILLIVMNCLLIMEKRATPVFVCGICALLLDFFYSNGFGYYSLPYVVVGIMLYLVLTKLNTDNFYVPVIVTGVTWLVKDLISALITFLQKNTFDFWYIFLRTTLPGILVNAILTIPFFFLYLWIYNFNFMHLPYDESSAAKPTTLFSIRKSKQ